MHNISIEVVLWLIVLSSINIWSLFTVQAWNVKLCPPQNIYVFIF